MFYRPTIRDVVAALKPLEGIPRPDGDNEGDPINGDTVFPFLLPEHQHLVSHAENTVRNYTRTDECTVNRRGVNAMTRNNFKTNLDPSQYYPDTLSGFVQVGENKLDISDAPPMNNDY